MFYLRQKILILAPHADDETLGCGGTILRAKEAGCNLYLIVFSIGNIKYFNEKNKTTTISQREKELKKAIELLSIDDYEVIFKDDKKHLYLDSIPRHDLVELIEKKCRLSLEKIKPDMVLLPNPSFHQDHEAVFKAGFTALRPHSPKFKHFANSVLMYESPYLSWTLHNFKPNLYVDISKFLDLKIKIWKAYASMRRDKLYPLSPDNIKNLCYLRGKEAGVKAAEAFINLRTVL